MKKISFFALTLIGSILFLQGCVPVVIMAGVGGVAAAGGAIIYDQRSSKTMTDDRNIASAAQTKIDSDQELSDKTHITVVVFNYRVLLIGQATTPELRDRVLNLVNGIPKIKFIHSEIVISNPISMKIRANDSWLTAKVKSALLVNKELYMSQIKIVTENEVVYLMGIVDKQKGDLAAKKASQIEGVKKVVKFFEYVP